MSIPMVVHGGRTGLVDGTQAEPSAIVISLERMNTIEDCDTQNRTITVGAGATLQSAQEAAQRHDLFFVVDLGARGSATIGGNIATNAGGSNVIRYGMMREQALGIVTRVILRLRSAASETRTAMLAANSFEDAITIVHQLDRRSAGRLIAFEVMWPDYYDLAVREVDVTPPLWHMATRFIF